MSLHTLARIHAGAEPVIDAADAEALSRLYGTSEVNPDWCDLTPALDTNRDGDDGLGGVRL